MRSHLAPLLCLGALRLLVETGSLVAADSPPTFERDVRPILKAQCFQCHGEEAEVEGSLDVRLARLIVSGGDSGPSIVPGKRDESLLYQRVRDGEMPPDAGHRLKQKDVEIIGRWIDAGAKTLRPEPEKIDGYLMTDEERSHWAWQPIARPTPPQVKHTDLVRTPIDQFILEKLEARGWSYSPEADRATLARRLYFDLLGLPPTPEQMQKFLADESPDAYERLIDELLAMPEYGERWGRHWLDVAGYADSEGYSAVDTVRDWAWKYRDYVIESFNDNVPFDQFLREQLAGDEMITSPLNNLTPDDARRLAATGFLRMAPDGSGNPADDINLARNDVVAGTISIVSSSLMGVTLACAQCHDHRYDPIPQTDYYQFRAIFEPALNVKQWRTPRQRLVSLYNDEDRAKAAEIEAEAKKIDAERTELQNKYIEETFVKQLETLPEEVRPAARVAFDTPAKDRTEEHKALFKKYPKLNVSAGSLYLYDRKKSDEVKALADKAAEVRATKPKEEFLHALTEIPGQVPPTHLFFRGSHEQPKQEVPPGTLLLTSLHTSAEAIPPKNPEMKTTGRRTALAERLTSADHPLVARVLVNRVWLHHFGRGIVSTPSDFGLLGTPPTHPELLDWLAREFISSGWNMKELHRLILRSTMARQALRINAEQDVDDPDNTLYGGAGLRRLEAEVVRDSVLSVTGRLNSKRFGPPVPVMPDLAGRYVLGIENLEEGRPGPVLPMNGEDYRRSVYVQVRRTRPLAMLDTFDWPRMEPNCNVRTHSTVTPQSLLLMNNDFILEQSRDFAARVVTETGEEFAPQIERVWQLAFSRNPDEAERASALAFLTEQAAYFETAPKVELPPTVRGERPRQPLPPPKVLALATLCQMLLSSNEFLYVD